MILYAEGLQYEQIKYQHVLIKTYNGDSFKSQKLDRFLSFK